MERETNPDELAQQYGSYLYPPVRGSPPPPPRHVVQQQMPAVRSPEGYRQSTTGRQSIRRNQMQPQGDSSSGRRGRATRDSRIHRSSDTTAAASHLLNREQNVAFQFQQHSLSPQSVRHAQPRQVEFSAPLQPPAEITSSTALQSALGQQQVYDMGFMLGFAQPGTAQIPYGMSSQQSLGGAAPGDGGARFGVPQQYLPLADDPESLSRYLSAQGQLAAAAPYPQPQQHSRILEGQEMHPNTLSSFNLTTSSRDMQQQQATAAENSANFEDTHRSFQQTLITVFGYTQRGFLNEASRLLLGLSQWLRENARDLGLFRDDSNTLTKHKQLWHEFNICWLALCQKQKDLTESLLRSAHHRQQRPLQQVLPATVLTSDSLETMAEEIIRFCDVLEPYGLVDYEIGLWEEEILDIIGQCLDLIGS